MGVFPHFQRLKGTKAVSMGKGQNEGGFSEDQIQMYKDCFKLMDINKDGILDKNDLRGAFDNVGVLMSESELDGLLGEVNGACTVDAMINMFAEKMAGEVADSDELILQAFMAYDNQGKMDSKTFEHALKTWGDKMTKAEIEDVFGLFVQVKEEPKVEEAPVVEEAAPEEDEDADAKRRRRRRRPPSKCNNLACGDLADYIPILHRSRLFVPITVVYQKPVNGWECTSCTFYVRGSLKR